MTNQGKIIAYYQQLFTEFEAGLNGLAHQPLHELQKKSIAALTRVQFPPHKHEDWRYTPVQRLVSPPYTLAPSKSAFHINAVDGLDSYIISFVNGRISSDHFHDLELKGVRLISLQEALRDQSWKEVFDPWIQFGEVTVNKAFEFLNFSFQSAGLFIDIPKNTVLDKPLELRFIHDAEDQAMSQPLYFVRCGRGSQVTLIERFESIHSNQPASSTGLINALAYIHLDDSAALDHIKWQNLPSSQHLVYKLFTIQKKNSRFNSFAFDRGGKMVRNNVELELEESNTYSSLQAGYVASGQQSMDHQTRINHKVPHCESHELYKGIVDGQASAAFNGKVFVHPDAQKTNAYQQNDTLVLSPHAVMNSKPQLEIYADDVKCSHGATIGQMDERALFYLKSRGLSGEQASQMLKEAFITDVLSKVPVESMRNYIQQEMAIA